MILYFSGTGNSRFVAVQLGELLKEEVISIGDYLKKGEKGNFTSEKAFVIVVPSYMSRMPMRVEQFVRESVFAGNKKIYFVMTAGQAIGNAGKYCKKLCEEKGMEYGGIQGIQMPANYVVMYDVLKRELAQEEAKKAIPAIQKIADCIQEGKTLSNEGLNSHQMFSAIAPAFTSMMVKAKSFYAEESCISCGTCKNICPLGNIAYQEGKPVWGNSCMHCMACISVCPEEAIQYGKATKGRNRYYLSAE